MVHPDDIQAAQAAGPKRSPPATTTRPSSASRYDGVLALAPRPPRCPARSRGKGSPAGRTNTTSTTGSTPRSCSSSASTSVPRTRPIWQVSEDMLAVADMRGSGRASFRPGPRARLDGDRTVAVYQRMVEAFPTCRGHRSEILRLAAESRRCRSSNACGRATAATARCRVGRALEGVLYCVRAGHHRAARPGAALAQTRSSCASPEDGSGRPAPGGIAHASTISCRAFTGALDRVQPPAHERTVGDVGPFPEGRGRAANRAAALHPRLLAFSRRRPSIRGRPTSTADLGMEGPDPPHWTTIAVEWGAGGPVPAKIDAPRSRRLLNPASNGADAMPEGGKPDRERRTNGSPTGPTGASCRPGQYISVSVTEPVRMSPRSWRAPSIVLHHQAAGQHGSASR